MRPKPRKVKPVKLLNESYLNAVPKPPYKSGKICKLLKNCLSPVLLCHHLPINCSKSPKMILTIANKSRDSLNWVVILIVSNSNDHPNV